MPSLVCERLRAPSRDVTLEPDAVRDLIKRVMLAEGTGERGESPVREWAAPAGSAPGNLGPAEYLGSRLDLESGAAGRSG